MDSISPLWIRQVKVSKPYIKQKAIEIFFVFSERCIIEKFGVTVSKSNKNRKLPEILFKKVVNLGVGIF